LAGAGRLKAICPSLPVGRQANRPRAGKKISPLAGFLLSGCGAKWG